MKTKPLAKILPALLTLILACAFLPALTLGFTVQLGELPQRADVPDSAAFPSAFVESPNGSAGLTHEIKPRVLVGDVYTFFSFAPDGKHYLWGSGRRPFTMFETTTDKRIWRSGSPDPIAAWTPFFSPNGNIVAAVGRKLDFYGGYEQPIWLLDAATGKRLRSLEQSDLHICRFDFSPDGLWIAAWSISEATEPDEQRCALIFWDVQTGKLLSKKMVAASMPDWQSFSRDGKYMVAEFYEPIVHNGQRPHAFRVSSEIWEMDGLTREYTTSFRVDSISKHLRSLEDRMNRGFRVRGLAKGTPYLCPVARRYSLKLSRDDRLLLWDHVDNKEKLQVSSPKRPLFWRADDDDDQYYPFSFQLAPDNSSLMLMLCDYSIMRSSNSTTILLFDVRIALHNSKALTLACSYSEQTLERAWAELGSEDQSKSFDSMCTLFARSHEACALLNTRLLPPSAANATLPATWLADLDHQQFKVREKTTNQLQQLDPSSLPLLRESRKIPKTTLEQKRRIDLAIAGIEKRASLIAAQEQRDILGIELLEQINTPAAKDVLTKIAQGEAYGWRAAEAKASLARIGEMRNK